MMEETIFDFIKNQNAEPPSEEQEFFHAAKNIELPSDEYGLTDLGEFGKTIGKGVIEGVSKLGRMMGPIPGRESTEEQLEKQTENLNKLAPTEEGYFESSIRRGLKEAPSMLAFPGSKIATLPRSIAAGFLGEGAKELGLPEWAQSAAELTAYVGPDVMSKLLTSGKNKDIIQFAKQMGMNDEEITPLIQSEFKQKWLTKLSPKRGKTQESLTDTKKALDRSYSKLQEAPQAGLEISELENGKLINGIKEKLSTMPREVQEKIGADLEDLIGNKITGKSLMNFWKDINANLSGSTKELSTLKEPIKSALKTISPELAQDFEMVNSLYSRFYPLAARLKPTLTSDIISAAETIGILGGGAMGVMYGDYSTLLTMFGEKGAKKIAQQMLINPRFQQLAEKTVIAVEQNKYGLVKKLVEDLKQEISKVNPEYGKKLPELSEEDFDKLFNAPPQTTKQKSSNKS
jgi:hypothetical protein